MFLKYESQAGKRAMAALTTQALNAGRFPIMSSLRKPINVSILNAFESLINPVPSAHIDRALEDRCDALHASQNAEKPLIIADQGL